MLALSVFVSSNLASDPCSTPPILPAYAHNDYLNPDPFEDALRLGYAGVEVDIFRMGGTLVVGHERRSCTSDRTLDALYLEPMARRFEHCGFIIDEPQPFLFNVELKETDPAAFTLLLQTLAGYPAMFESKTVSVVLVGWWPTPPRIGQPWPDYLGVQQRWESSRTELARARDHTRLVSIDYAKSIRWNGRGSPPGRARQALEEARQRSHVLGVPLRVHQVPKDCRVYAWLLGSGADLLGIKDLSTETVKLRSLRHPPRTW